MLLSGIIKSGSNSILIPKPLHSLHAPKGELKEKDLGSIFPILILQNGHELYLENKNSLLSIMVITIPCVSFVFVKQVLFLLFLYFFYLHNFLQMN